MAHLLAPCKLFLVIAEGVGLKALLIQKGWGRNTFSFYHSPNKP